MDVPNWARFILAAVMLLVLLPLCLAVALTMLVPGIAIGVLLSVVGAVVGLLAFIITVATGLWYLVRKEPQQSKGGDYSLGQSREV